MTKKSTGNIILFRKQIRALSLLNNPEVNELFYGGAAGGGKSFLGCVWQISMRRQYPGTRGLIGRAELKRLKQTTLKTFFEACAAMGLIAGVHFRYHQQDGVIYFDNGSLIYLFDLKHQPSDPDYQTLGSLEITDAFIDEASEITSKAKNITLSRCRFQLDKFGLTPKILLTSNPTKNWPYTVFYKPNKSKTLPPHRRFIQALATDNPFISRHYIDSLGRLDKNSKERLLYGNWEFDDDPNALFDIESLNDIFHIKADQSKGLLYLSADVARKKDKSVIKLWRDLQIKKVWNITPGIDIMTEKLIKISEHYNVPRSRIIVDEDGVGGGVVDNLKGCKGFLNGSRPIESRREKKNNIFKKNYANLKAQCYLKLSELVLNGKIGIDTVPEKIMHEIIEELELMKEVDAQKDGAKISVTDKKEIKKSLGRSPDYADTMMMRMYFELKPPKILTTYFK